MNGFEERSRYAEEMAARARAAPTARLGAAFAREAERVSADIRLFARTRKDDGAVYPPWALTYRPGQAGAAYCSCERPAIDYGYDGGCRRCGLPVNLAMEEER